MSLDTLTVDAYQLTTLVAHADAGRLAHRLAMAFFLRKLPKNRNYVVFAGLRQILAHAAAMRVDPAELDALERHPLFGAALRARPAVVEALRRLDGFDGDIDALPEGTLVFAGPGLRTDGAPFTVAGTQVQLYAPFLQVRTDMVRAKLIETPWLGRINHLSMVASKAARVVEAAKGKIVLEFGARRTHPAAAVDVSYAAYLAGTTASSNVAADLRYGVPTTGTMDHFFVQAAERDEVGRADSERGAFRAFYEAFPHSSTMLVDTYDTLVGIRHAVEATAGKLTGIRLDSNVTPETARQARALLDELGAPQAKIIASDGLDEYRVRGLEPYCDGFGVGENISCSPDSPVGVGAVAKVVVNGYGEITMKLARGSGKATLPGLLQVWRYPDHDLVALADEATPAGGRALLRPVWRGRAPVEALPSLEESRAEVRRQIEALPPPLRALEPAERPRPMVASDGLAALVEREVTKMGFDPHA
jgi:nicotinate phosphoribosyltransferase